MADSKTERSFDIHDDCLVNGSRCRQIGIRTLIDSVVLIRQSPKESYRVLQTKTV